MRWARFDNGGTPTYGVVEGDTIIPVFKTDGTYYSVCRGFEIPLKQCPEGVEWAATPSSMVGTTIGYRVRGETRVGASTRIEVITEGVLTRMLLDDPALEGVAAVLFDEFHERSVNADFGLALALQSQSLLRPDLRILIMSATLDGDAVAALLNDAPIVTSVGRAHPVVVRYHSCRADLRIEACVAQVVRTPQS